MSDGTPFLRVAADRIGAPGSPAKMPFRATNAATWSSIIRTGAKMAVIRRRIARRAVSSPIQRAGTVPYGESRLKGDLRQAWTLAPCGADPAGVVAARHPGPPALEPSGSVPGQLPEFSAYRQDIFYHPPLITGDRARNFTGNMPGNAAESEAVRPTGRRLTIQETRRDTPFLRDRADDFNRSTGRRETQTHTAFHRRNTGARTALRRHGSAIARSAAVASCAFVLLAVSFAEVSASQRSSESAASNAGNCGIQSVIRKFRSPRKGEER